MQEGRRYKAITLSGRRLGPLVQSAQIRTLTGSRCGHVLGVSPPTNTLAQKVNQLFFGWEIRACNIWLELFLNHTDMWTAASIAHTATHRQLQQPHRRKMCSLHTHWYCSCSTWSCGENHRFCVFNCRLLLVVVVERASWGGFHYRFFCCLRG